MMRWSSQSSFSQSKHYSQNSSPPYSPLEVHPSISSTDTHALSVAGLISDSEKSIRTPESWTPDELRKPSRKSAILPDSRDLPEATGLDSGGTNRRSLIPEITSNGERQAGGRVASSVARLGASAGQPFKSLGVPLSGFQPDSQQHLSYMPSLDPGQDRERSIQARVKLSSKISVPSDLEGGWFRETALSFDGLFLAAVVAQVFDSWVVVWETSSTREVFRSKALSSSLWPSLPRICFSPDGRLLATIISTGIHIFETSGWTTTVLKSPVPTWTLLKAAFALDLHVPDLGFSPDSSILAVGNNWRDCGDVLLWDTKTWSQIAHRLPRDEKMSNRTKFAFSPMDELLIVASTSGENARMTRICSLPMVSNGGELDKKLLDLDVDLAVRGQPRDLHVSFDGNLVAASMDIDASSHEVQVQVYERAGWRELGRSIQGQCLGFTADNRFLVVLDKIKKELCLWSLPEMEKVATILDHIYSRAKKLKISYGHTAYSMSKNLIAVRCKDRATPAQHIRILKMTITES